MIKLTEGEIEYIFRDPDALRCLANYWSVQETLFNAQELFRCGEFAKGQRERYAMLADQAQVAIDNGD